MLRAGPRGAHTYNTVLAKPSRFVLAPALTDLILWTASVNTEPELRRRIAGYQWMRTLMRDKQGLRSINRMIAKAEKELRALSQLTGSQAADDQRA